MKKVEVIIRVVLTLVVILFNVIPHVFFSSIPVWPMFLAAIFFFLLAEGNIKEIPHILVSGATGIILTVLMFIGIGFLTPLIGGNPAYIICLSAILFVVIVGGVFSHFALNNITFMFLIMASSNIIAARNIDSLEAALNTKDYEPFSLFAECGAWLAVLVLGGTLICFVCSWIMASIKGYYIKKQDGKR